jgi:hypothetical protein
MPPKKKAKKTKKGTTMSQNVKQSVVVHVNTTTRRQPTRSGNRSQPMSRIQTPQFVGVVGQDYSTYNNQLNNITQAIANSIKQPDRTGNLITTPPRQAPDVPIHNAPAVQHTESQTTPSIVNIETQTMPTMEAIRQARLTKIQTPAPNSPLSSNTPTGNPPPLTAKDVATAFVQRAIDDSLRGLPIAQSRPVAGRRAKSQPALARYTKASTSEKDPQTRITDFIPTNQGQAGGQEGRREGARSIKRSLLPRGQPAEEPPETTPKKRAPRADKGLERLPYTPRKPKK